MDDAFTSIYEVFGVTRSMIFVSKRLQECEYQRIADLHVCAYTKLEEHLKTEL